jgi:hypothetical protein
MRASAVVKRRLILQASPFLLRFHAAAFAASAFRHNAPGIVKFFYAFRQHLPRHPENSAYEAYSAIPD